MLLIEILAVSYVF